MACAFVWSERDGVFHFRPENQWRLTIIATVFPAMWLTVVWLRRKVARALAETQREQDELFAAIMGSLHDAIIETDWKGIRDVNASFCRMTGFSREELIGTKPPYPFWPEEQYAALAAALETSMRGQAMDFEFVFNRKNGERFPALCSVSRITDDAGKIRRVVYSIKDIADLKRTEASLRESEQRLMLAVSATRMSVWEVDRRTGRWRFDDRMTEILGKSRQEIEEAGHFLQQVEPEDKARIEAAIARAWETSEPLEMEFRIRRPDGQVRWLLSHARTKRDEGTGESKMFGTTQDITAQKQAEESLRESERRFRLFYEDAPLAYQSLDETGRIREVNPSWLKLLGYNREEVIGRLFSDFWSPEHQPDFAACFEGFKASGEVRGAEIELVRKDGERLTVTIDGLVSRDENGRFVQTHCILVDITQRRRAEQETADSHARLTAAFMNVPFDAWILDSEGRYIFLNNVSQRNWGNLLGRHTEELDVPSAVKEQWIANNRRAFGGEVVRREADYPVEGKLRHFEEIIVPVMVNEQIRGVLGINIDVTQRQRAARLAAAQRQILYMIASGAPLGELLNKIVEATEEQAPGCRCAVLVLSEDGKTLRAAAAPSFSAAHRGNLSALPVGPMGFSSGIAAYTGRRVITEDIATDPAWERGREIMLADGIRSVFASPLFSRTGKVLGTLAIYRTEPGSPDERMLELHETACHLAAIAIERRREEELIRQSSAELQAASAAKDRFLAMLSHELRTPLTPVLATASVLREDPTLPARAREEIELIRRNAEMEARLIDSLLDLAQASNEQMELTLGTLDLRQLLEELAAELQPELAQKGVQFHKAIPEGRIELQADAARLRQAVANLLENAAHYTPAGGTLSLRTWEDRSEGRREQVIEVSDTGIGIEPELLGRLFTPFQRGARAAAINKGTLGLGLALSRAVVASHGGRIEAHSAGPGKGATFTIHLPKQPAAAELKINPAQQMSLAGLHILLVEDHADTQRVMSNLLRRIGCRVTSAGSVAQAMEAAAKEQFNLLISDIGLPDGTGVELIKKLRNVQPLPGIALSGFGLSEDIRRSREAGFFCHLVKPVNFAALEDAILKLVASTRVNG